MTASLVIFDFNQSSDITTWQIVDDVVMGGKSSGNFTLNEEGMGVFEGSVSLENNGGFSSARYQFEKVRTASYGKFIIRVKGDGKKYQFRVKSDVNDRHSYITHISTSGEWQAIEIPFEKMYPSYRGNRLDQPDFSGEHMAEIAFLIGNKRPQQFKLLIDKIEIK